MNPLAQLPPAVRLWAYIVLGLLAAGIGAWQASEGDVLTAISLFLGTLGLATAGSNTPTQPQDQLYDRKRQRGVPR